MNSIAEKSVMHGVRASDLVRAEDEISAISAISAIDVVSVIVPTLLRHASLERAVRSVLGQNLPHDIECEIIVVDNSADGNAAPVVERLAREGGNIRYINETSAGVANARNAGVRAARGRWIAFLDDDEEASVAWLSSLVTVARQTRADAVFGPVEARADGEAAIGPFAPYFARSIERENATDVTQLAAYLGTNNSMFDRVRCLSADVPFDTSLNSTGGEDSLFLKSLVLQKRKFAWARSAGVIEWVPARRLNWDYVRKRKFLSGQIRVFVLHMTRPTQWSRIAVWMGVGLLQCSAGWAAACALDRLNRDAAERARAFSYGGLGKLLWMPRFRPELYGRGHVS